MTKPKLFTFDSGALLTEDGRSFALDALLISGALFRCLFLQPTAELPLVPGDDVTLMHQDGVAECRVSVCTIAAHGDMFSIAVKGTMGR